MYDYITFFFFKKFYSKFFSRLRGALRKEPHSLQTFENVLQSTYVFDSAWIFFAFYQYHNC